MLAGLPTLLLSPVPRLLRKKRARPEEIRRFYRSVHHSLMYLPGTQQPLLARINRMNEILLGR